MQGGKDSDDTVLERAASPAALPTVAFHGTARYVPVRPLGEGGFGAVYEVEDRVQGGRVALKLLRMARADSLYRFKREFRTLCEIRHANLVRLYELATDADRWFFTMELVDGLPLDEHVAGGPERLRPALRQVAGALCAVHAAGKLHRDLKPANILVDRTSRVVLLDFGLAVDLHTDFTVEIAGTASYMSPEQASGRPIGEPSDWYSFGVILYQILSGRTPFAGTFAELQQAKSSQDPPALDSLVPGAPADLVRLCHALLARDPAARPTGEQVLAELDGGPAPARAAPELFVGRGTELAALHAAHEATRAGRPLMVLVHAPSGMGKSALLARFAREVEARDTRTLVLAGRCLEPESVPYKALDSLIDKLARRLARMSDLDAEGLVPRHAGTLVRLFPVLRQVAALERHAARERDRSAPVEQRRHGVEALRELLLRLCDRHAVVLCVDDLQWGDADSARLLSKLLRPPGAPPLLFVGTYRSEEAASSAFLSRLAELSAELEVREVAFSSLGAGEAEELAARRLAELGEDAGRAPLIARESDGSPFFIEELARHKSEGEPATTLSTLIRGRALLLDEPARRLLETVAVAAAPIAVAAAAEAAGVSGPREALARLHDEHLLRYRDIDGDDYVESYHDRIRASVVAGLDEARRRALHLRIGSALERADSADHERLASHFAQGGEPARAAGHATRAAEAATAALAFDHAARLFRLALDLRLQAGLDGAETTARRQLLGRLGDVLGDAGRVLEAAESYLAAAEGADEAAGLELRSRALYELMQGGHLERARALHAEVLSMLGLRLPGSRAGLVARLLLGRVGLRLRGWRHRERDEESVPRGERLRGLALWSTLAGYAVVDPLVTAALMPAYLRMALGSGDPAALVRGFCAEAMSTSLRRGARVAGRSRQLLEDAARIAQRLDRAEERGFVAMSEGVVAMNEGRWPAALACLERAARERGSLGRQAHETHRLWIFRMSTLHAMGRTGDIGRGLRETARDLDERGNLVGWVFAAICVARIRLTEDRPAESRALLESVRARWPGLGPQLPQLYATRTELERLLYEGDAQAAGRLLERAWPSVEDTRRSLGPTQWLSSLQLRASVDIARGALPAAGRATRRLAALPAPFAPAVARALEAAIAGARGDDARAAGLLEKALPDLDAHHLELMGAAARRRRGQLLGGEAGRALIAEADAWLRGQDVAVPERWCGVVLPWRS